jgi:medium-chain acyl-[acyl-carrier-protein] hydrolase
LDQRIEVLPVRLPGREGRVREPAFDDFRQLLDCLFEELADLWRSPYALFGHSMGALIAYELAQRTTTMGSPPVCLFVSACRAPNRISGTLPPLHVMPDEEMIDGLLERYGWQVEADERALMLMLSDTLRADLRLLDSYERLSAAILSCPLFACGGADDPVVTRADLCEWQATTEGPFTTRVFPGGHFFLRTHHKPLGNFVQQKLLGLLV